MTRLITALLLSLLLAPSGDAQYALPSSVIAAGATESTGGVYTVHGTIGQAVVGASAGGTYTLQQGFWPSILGGSAPPTPNLTITLAPLGAPITIPTQGGSFQFIVTVTNHTSTTQTFHGWTEATLPNGSIRLALNPQTLTLGPGASLGPITLRQQVPGIAPAGMYTYSAFVGTFPSIVVDTDSFPFSKAPEFVASAQFVARPSRTSIDPASSETSSAREPSVLGRAEPTSPTSRRPATRTTSAPRLQRDDRWSITVASSGEPVVERGDLLAAVLRDAWAPRERATSGEEALVRDAPTASVQGALPERMSLHAAYPNPFNQSATLRYDLPAASSVCLVVYDALGRAVAVLTDGPGEAGTHTAVFDGAALPSGVYFVRLVADGQAQTQRLTLLR